jgi:hypothetical protein
MDEATGTGVGFGMTMEAIPGFAILAADVDKLGIDIRSFRVPLKRAIQQVVAPSLGENFLAGGRPDSWVPLTDATIQIKQEEGSTYPPEQILMRTGLLFTTIQQLNIWEITTTQASIPALPDKIAYGEAHEFGLGFNPERPFIVLQDQDLDKVDKVFEDWLYERALARLVV